MTDDDGYVRITLRIPKELHDELVISAKQTSKSMNAEIIDRLRNISPTKQSFVAVMEGLIELKARFDLMEEKAKARADRLKRRNMARRSKALPASKETS